MNTTAARESRARQASAARRDVEDTLDASGWPWSLRLSRWVDALTLLIEERTA